MGLGTRREDVAGTRRECGEGGREDVAGRQAWRCGREIGNRKSDMEHGKWEMGNGKSEIGNGRGCGGYFRRLKVLFSGVVVRDFSPGLGFKILCMNEILYIDIDIDYR